MRIRDGLATSAAFLTKKMSRITRYLLSVTHAILRTVHPNGEQVPLARQRPLWRHVIGFYAAGLLTGSVLAAIYYTRPVPEIRLINEGVMGKDDKELGRQIDELLDQMERRLDEADLQLRRRWERCSAAASLDRKTLGDGMWRSFRLS